MGKTAKNGDYQRSFNKCPHKTFVFFCFKVWNSQCNIKMMFNDRKYMKKAMAY